MPAKSGAGAAQLKQKYNVFVGGMTGPKTESAMAKVLSIGVSGAKQLAPIGYGTMIDSAYRRIDKVGSEIRGEAGFSNGTSLKGFNYAFYLHETFKWNPRPPDKKAAPAWNPDATPKFLQHGFTDPEQLELMRKAIKGSYKL